jgi:hypothetical protein
MIQSKKLLTDLKKQVTLLENDLRQRCKDFPEIDAPLRAQYDAAKAGKRTAMTYGAWLDEQLTQVAVAWVLGCVFVRFLEDNALVDVPKLAGPGALGQRARDEHELYFRKHPTLTEREYLEGVFTETGTLPAMREFFDRRHNPLWQCGPSGDAAAALLDFWRRTDPDSGLLVHDFSGPEWNTRFLGDLYQDLSEAARKKYALLQTPEFIEEFILDRTLCPAIDTFGYQVVRLIDPTCGSGHFLLGGFFRMFRLWQRENPGENPRVLAQNALDAIHGVDLNPYAVAIARFRLLLAALQVCGITKLKNAPDFSIHLASGDSLLHGRRFRELEGESRRQSLFETDDDVFRDELRHHYEVEDTEALHRILGQQYHVVVGNPPYITVKDAALSELYRARFPSCHRVYSLSVPFMERFFDLAVRGDGTPHQPAGFVGKITGNAFMKREFGKKLIEEYLPRWDLTHVLDTSGAYIPGHGTPTVIIFGKNQPPVSGTIRTVLGIRGEPVAPSEPAQGLVWRAICQQVDQPGSDSDWASASDSPRIKFHKHPWSIGGGGAAELKEQIVTNVQTTLRGLISELGRTTVLGDNDAWVFDSATARRKGFKAEVVPLGTGDCIRDWAVDELPMVVHPYVSLTGEHYSELHRVVSHYLWRFRPLLSARSVFGKTVDPWFVHLERYTSKLRAPLSLVFPLVATYNSFVLDRGGKVFKHSAPVIKLLDNASEHEHLAMLGVINSSAASFWMKQTLHDKGGGGIGGGLATEKWEHFFEFDAAKLKQFPIPTRKPSQLPTALDKTSTALQAQSPAAVLNEEFRMRNDEGAAISPCVIRHSSLREALSRALDFTASHRRKLIAWQEELDWQVYEAYGLIEASDAVSQPEGEAMDAIPPDGITLGQRAFEIVLARRMGAGEVQTTWFTRHGSTPITEIPTHWPIAYRELVERRIRRIESDSNIRLIEQPEYKRRWNTESWDSQFQRAATQWLLLRLETYFHGSERMKAEIGGRESKAGNETPGASSNQKSTIRNPQSSISSSFDPAAHGFIAASRPHLVSAQQLAEVVQADSLFLEVAECLEGHSGFSVSALVQRLVEAESVPALPRDRYKDSGLRKREDWEETWRLQRQEDEIEEEVKGLNVEGRKSEEELKKRIRKAQLERVGDIPVPPKYGSPDFKKASYWRLRGKLDVPKERWISYPGAERDGDTSPVIAWAGWDHLQQAQALAEYFLDAKAAHGWPPAKLKPLLAALADLLPWLKQWHNTFDPNYGMGLGDYFQGFLEEQCRALEMTVQEVDAVRFEVSTEPARTPARKQTKKRGRKGAAAESPDAGEDAREAGRPGHWQDQAFALLAPKRKKLTDYRMLVWPELLRQMPGDMEFETFRKAYWLLSEPAELEKLGRGVFQDVPVSWWRSRSEQLAKDEFLGTLKGSVTLGEVRIWKEHGVRLVCWNGRAEPSDFPEAVDDARIALQLATLWTDKEPDAVRELIEDELALLETP